MKLLLILLIVLLASCSAQQRAQRHLRRAIELDPTIISKLDTKVKIDTTLVHDTIVVIKATTDTTQSNIDSIITQYKVKGSATLLENEKLKIQLQNIKGKQTIVVQTKEVKIPIRDTIRVTLTKTVPAITVHERVYVHGFFWWLGIITLSLLGVFLILMILSKLLNINLFKWHR